MRQIFLYYLVDLTGKIEHLTSESLQYRRVGMSPHYSTLKVTAKYNLQISALLYKSTVPRMELLFFLSYCYIEMLLRGM